MVIFCAIIMRIYAKIPYYIKPINCRESDNAASKIHKMDKSRAKTHATLVDIHNDMYA